MSKRKNTSIVKYQTAVDDIRGLLAHWLESGVDLCLKLRVVDQSGVWKHPGHATFADFLRAEFPTALGIERYQNVVNAVDMYGVARVKQIGIESCHALTVRALQDSPQKRAAVLSGIDNFVKRNGCSPDRNKVRELVAAVAPETRRPPRELLDEEAQLRAQLIQAKARIRDLERDVRRLEKENARLAKKKKACAKRSSARAPN